MSPCSFAILLVCLASAVCGQSVVPAFQTNVVGPWLPIFRGIDHASGQLASIGASNEVVHALRIDLMDPAISFVTTPRMAGTPPEWGETTGQTTSSFLRTSGAQVAVNANYFYPCCYTGEGGPLFLQGLAISRGDLVSVGADPTFSAMLLVTTDNVPSIVFTNSPAVDLAGVYTAVSGNRPLLVHGTNVGEVGPVHPRTAVGYSEDKRYLILLTVDGRQAGYSDGVTDFETANWMLRFGAFEALNLDGGGSTTMAMSDGHGQSRLLNRPIHNGVPEMERVCGNHLGVYAAALPDPGMAGHDAARIAISQPIKGVTLVASTGQPTRTYRIQYSDALSSSWNTLTVQTADSSGTVKFFDVSGVPARYYRLAFP